MTKENAHLLLITDQNESELMIMILADTAYKVTELNLAPYRRAEKEDVIARYLMTHEYDAVLVPEPLQVAAAVRAQHLGPVIGYSGMVQDRGSYNAVINLIQMNTSNPGKIVTDSLESCL